jgi:hypothetical protein
LARVSPVQRRRLLHLHRAQPAALRPTAAQPAASPLDDGHYIVMLKDKPLATYSGGVPGIPGTAVPKGKKLNPSGPNSRKYDAHLKAKQRQAAASTGVTINRSYTLALNGFSAVSLRSPGEGAGR